MVKPRFAEFQYVGTDDRNLITRIVNGREKQLVETGFNSDTAGQQLATFVTTPEVIKGDELIVRTTAFSDDNGRESGAVFDALIAVNTGRRVIAANAPGVDFYSKHEDGYSYDMTPDQLEDLRSGSFRKVGSAVMVAIDTMASRLSLDRKYVVTASSMGAALTAGMLSEARRRGNKVTGLTLAEAVNVHERSLAKLGLHFMQQPTVPGYLAQNPQVLRDLDEPSKDWIERVRHDFSANLRYAKAMARGAFMADLGAIDHLEGIPVFVSRGGGSKLSPQFTLGALKNRFEGMTHVESRVFGDSVENPHNHPYTMTVQSVIDAIDKVT